MKRQILCPKCTDDTRKRFPTDNPYPGEHIKFVRGTAKLEFKCDHCDKKIVPGEEATAYSVWADHGRQPYHEWENDFIVR